MEHIPARLLRPIALACPSAPQPTARQLQTRAYILEAATGMYAKYGHPRIGMKNLAESCGLSPSTIRRHVCDLHYLFRLVLTAHLDMLLAAIGEIPNHHPDRQARARAEYHRLTRDQQNRLTPIHTLLVRYRFALPDDQLDPIEDQRRMIGIILAGNEWESAFDLLDGAAIGLDRIEAKLTAEPAPIAIPAAAPAAATPKTPQPFQFTQPHFAAPAQPSASRQALFAASTLATPPPRQHAA
jgi:AcrR family transcriptional regulator